MGSLLDAALSLSAAALAVYIGVRLIESVAATLFIIAAVIGGLVVVSFEIRALWRRGSSSRW